MKNDISVYLNPGKFVSGVFLAKKLGITRSAINKKIHCLISEGFIIESRRNRGYCLKKTPDVLNAFRLQNYFLTIFPDGKVIYKKECSSTQIIAKKQAEQTGQEMLIVAEKQSAGYGRIQRKWLSPPGGLWFSLLLRPNILPDESSHLTSLMALAIVRVFRGSGIFAGIKWPNDVLIEGRKVCGILTEISAELDKIYWVIIGTGINVNNKIPEDIADAAINLQQILGRNIDRTGLLIKILQNFFGLYRDFLKYGFKKFSREYEKFLLFRNKTVKIKQMGKIISGKLVGINERGHLIIKTGGEKVEVLAGDLVKGDNREK